MKMGAGRASGCSCSVRNLALDAELKGQKKLAEKLRAVADETEMMAKPEQVKKYLARRLDAEGLPKQA